MTLTILEKPPALPPEAQKELEQINQALSIVEAEGSEGRINATLRTLGNEECRKMAERIISLYLLARGGMCED